MKLKIASLFLAAILVFALTSCELPVKEEISKIITDIESAVDSSPETGRETEAVSESLVFDGLEFTFDDDYSIVELDNEYSELNGRDIVRLGVTVKNVSDEDNRLNMFFYTLIGPDGEDLEGVSFYFDDSIDMEDDLKPGASYHTYFYFLYVGEGEYVIDFDSFTDEAEARFTFSGGRTARVPENDTEEDTTPAESGASADGPFEFDGLRMKLDDDYTFVTVDNEFSDYYGDDVVRLGVTVENVSDENNSLNMFFYEVFGSKGTELDSVTFYFDDSVDNAGDLKPGASYHTYFYFLYDGDGTYSIDFDNWTEEISVSFDIVK